MMITTKKVKLTPKDLFRILVIQYLKKRWWMLGWMLILVFLILNKEVGDSFDQFFIVFAIFYPLLILLQFWRYVVAKDNKILLLDRYYEIDNDKITTIVDDDSYSPINLKHFIKADVIGNSYILYVSKNQFVYIPIDAFESIADKLWFENEIFQKIKTQ